MSIIKPVHIPGKRFVLTKNMILNAQKETISGRQAAKWLKVSYPTYKKWAKYYNIFEQHKNQKGVGTKKGWASYRIPLEDFFEGKRELPTNYSGKVLKKRMLEEGYLQEECSNCGYNEVNVATQKVCLNIDFIDGNNKNISLDNIRLLCANCYLSFNGSFPKSKVFCK